MPVQLFLILILHPFFVVADSVSQFNPTIAQRQTTSPFCTISTQYNQQTLLQINGTVEHLISFTLCSSRTSNSNLLHSFNSSSPRVLPPDSAHVSMQALQSASACYNISTLLSFDAFVGKTTFTFIATSRDSPPSSCHASILYTIAGFTIFHPSVSALSSRSSSSTTLFDNPVNSAVIYSGLTNVLLSDYRSNLQQILRSFRVHVQYPDGSDATTRSLAEQLSSLQTMRIFSLNDASSPVRLDQQCNAVSTLPISALPANCGASFAPDTNRSLLAFSLRYIPYKDGFTTLLCEWPSFTEGSDLFFDDEYHNVLFISVKGHPPPIIEDVYPRQQLWRAGGQNITLVFDNVDNSTSRIVTLDNLKCPEIPGSFRRRRDGLYTAEFISPAGSGSYLQLAVSVGMLNGSFIDAKLVADAKDLTLSYSSGPLVIESIEPRYSAVGTTATITGNFDRFDPSNPNHTILLGQRPLSLLSTFPRISDDRRSIRFQVPEREKVGSAYAYPISVVVNSETSNSLELLFVPEAQPIFTIRVYGASRNEKSDQYELGICGPTIYFAEFPSGFPNSKTFNWSIVEGADSLKRNLLLERPNINSASRELRVPHSIFRVGAGQFFISVSSELGGVKAAASVAVVIKQEPIIGVSLVAPAERSISFPDVAVRVTAQISISSADCFQDLSPVVYEWSYNGRTYVTKSTNQSGTALDRPAPRRLGREFVIPQAFLEYGNLSISLRAYMRDDPRVAGVSATTVRVTPTSIVPVIGYGALQLVHNMLRDLEINASDKLFTKREIRSTIRYHWTCTISSELHNYDNGSECEPQILPNANAKSFCVSKDALLRQRDVISSAGCHSECYSLRYTLQIGIGSFLSKIATQSIAVSSVDSNFATTTELLVFDSRGIPLPQQNIPYYDDILIVPQGSSDSINWKFETLSSIFSSNILANPGKVLLREGYYDIALNVSQRSPLAIRAYALSPFQDYRLVIKIFSSESGMKERNMTFLLRTIDQPKLILRQMSLTQGDTKTVFSASAGVNLDARISFQYYFFAIDEAGHAHCLDGCGGSESITFRIPISGTFRILVRLRDVNGIVILDETEFPRVIEVSDESDSSSTALGLNRAAALVGQLEDSGDHGTIEHIASLLYSLNETSESGSINTTANAKSFSLVVNTLQKIVSNAIPSTMGSKNYVQIAARLASMRDEFISIDTVKSLLWIVDAAIRRVPRSESFDHESDMKAFYNLTQRHVFRLYRETNASGYSNGGNASDLDAKRMVSEVFRLMQEHLTIVMSRNAQCGTSKRMDTRIKPAMSVRSISGSVSELPVAVRQISGSFDFLRSYETLRKLQYSSFSLIVKCSWDRSLSLQGEKSSFGWCQELVSERLQKIGNRFDASKKYLFSMLETMDYIFETDMIERDHESDTVFLTNTQVSCIDQEGVTKVNTSNIPSCFHLNMSMTRLGITANGGCLSAEGYHIEKAKAAPCCSGRRNFSSVETMVARDGKSEIVVKTSDTGLFGAMGVHCPVNARRPQIEVPPVDVEFRYIAVGGAIVAVVGVGVAWATMTSSFGGIVAAFAA